jgi:RNA polymerase sigma-70 factor (ECF subfamily)
MNISEEKILIAETLNGNNRAFEILMRAYEKKVFGLAFNFTNSPEEAKDILQDTFIRAYKNLSSFRGESSFSTWIYRIATNVCLTKYREKKYNLNFLRFNNEFSSDEKEENQIIDLNANLDHNLMKEEILGKIKAISEKLPPRQKIAFYLRFYEDMKISEIAKSMNITEGAAKRYIHNSINKIKKEIEKIGVKEFYG